MLFAFIFCSVAAVAFAGPSSVNHASWNQFKLAHNKVYDPQEERLRFQIFSENLKKIEEHNALFDAGFTTYKKGVNKFADMTQEEFVSYLNLPRDLPRVNGSLGTHIPNPNIKLPESIDYRDLGAVNPVKSQAQCGSCWAFSTAGTLESINFLKNGVLLSLSEQNLVDCGTKTLGCKGGWPSDAFDYIRDNGLESEDDYPYTAHDDTCKFDKSKSVITVSGNKAVARGSEEDLKSAVGEVGPVSVCLDATELQLYHSGIFYAKNPQYQINHAVIAVGYGSENGEDYWIVRNSWGDHWGEKGYVRIARNAGNQIGIADVAVYPVL